MNLKKLFRIFIFRKNLGTITRLARTGSFKGMRKEMRRVSQTTRLPGTRIVGGNQDHILAALIETQHSLPYQEEMVENYLQEARFRYETKLSSPGSQVQVGNLA